MRLLHKFYFIKENVKLRVMMDTSSKKEKDR